MLDIDGGGHRQRVANRVPVTLETRPLRQSGECLADLVVVGVFVNLKEPPELSILAISSLIEPVEEVCVLAFPLFPKEEGDGVGAFLLAFLLAIIDLKDAIIYTPHNHLIYIL